MFIRLLFLRCDQMFYAPAAAAFLERALLGKGLIQQFVHAVFLFRMHDHTADICLERVFLTGDTVIDHQAAGQHVAEILHHIFPLVLRHRDDKFIRADPSDRCPLRNAVPDDLG